VQFLFLFLFSSANNVHFTCVAAQADCCCCHLLLPSDQLCHTGGLFFLPSACMVAVWLFLFSAACLHSWVAQVDCFHFLTCFLCNCFLFLFIQVSCCCCFLSLVPYCYFLSSFYTGCLCFPLVSFLLTCCCWQHWFADGGIGLLPVSLLLLAC